MAHELSVDSGDSPAAKQRCLDNVEATTQPGLKKRQLLLFPLDLYLGSRNALEDIEVIHDGLVKAYMLDGLFQRPTEENPVGLDNLVRKRDLECSTILLRTGLGGSRRTEPDRQSFHS